LTYSGRFTHISGHPSAAGRVQDGESSPAKQRRSNFYHPVSTVHVRNLLLKNWWIRCCRTGLFI